jgi:hypothetical protein
MWQRNSWQVTVRARGEEHVTFAFSLANLS